MSEEKPMPHFDPFLRTGFSYKYLGEGNINIGTFGYINTITIKDKEIRAFFRSTLDEPYIVHARGDGFFGVTNANKEGFSIVSLHESNPIKKCKWVSALISRVPDNFLTSDAMRMYLND